VVLALSEGRFKPVPVTVGGEWNGLTEILDGVEADDPVVLSGQFLIDSEASLNAGFARMESAPAQDHEGHDAPEVIAETEGTINAVDAAKRSINVSHGPIPAIGWPPMTMDFGLAEGIDAAHLSAGMMITLGLGRDTAGAYIAARVTPKTEATQ
jgi:Cu(I)/Ag(I) efflux system membrane fusion protein